MAIFVDKLKAEVIANAKLSDKIVVITGYFSPDVIEEIADLGIPFEFYYGMYAVDKIRAGVLKALRGIVSSRSNLAINVVHMQRVHTKCYLFYKDGAMFNAFVGSANCSMQGLCSSKNAEMLAELNTTVLKKNDYLIRLDAYYKKIKKISLNINDPKVIAKRTPKIKAVKPAKGFLPLTSDPLTAIMPLYAFDKKGKRVDALASGPNWGNQKGHTAKNGVAMEAYLTILTSHLDNYPLLFQPYPVSRKTTGGKKTRMSDPVTVIWDDGRIMTMTFQGSQRHYPSKSNPLMVYPKQLSYGDASTKAGGAILGAYLRDRMNVGPFHVITVKDLDAYGKDHVELHYVSPGLYTADFSGKRFRKTIP